MQRKNDAKESVQKDSGAETQNSILNKSGKLSEKETDSQKEPTEQEEKPTEPTEELIEEESVSQDDKAIMYKVDPTKLKTRMERDKKLKEKLEARSKLPATGNPDARIADPREPSVEPRYIIVQNTSESIILVPDLKSHVEDLGLAMMPGQIEVLTDFYSPREINKSRGLLYAATQMPGVSGYEHGLTPLQTVEEGKNFQLPKKAERPKRTPIEDTADNPFDHRFAEVEMRDAKREEKLRRKNIGLRATKKHGQAPSHV